MANKPAADPTFGELVEGVVQDAQELIRQQFDLLRVEVREEIDQAKRAAVATGAGVGLLCLGGVLSAHALAHLLQRTTGLPLWACYGTVSGLLLTSGAGLLAHARGEAADVHLLPPEQTAEALRENLTWAKDQLTPARG